MNKINLLQLDQDSIILAYDHRLKGKARNQKYITKRPIIAYISCIILLILLTIILIKLTLEINQAQISYDNSMNIYDDLLKSINNSQVLEEKLKNDIEDLNEIFVMIHVMIQTKREELGDVQRERNKMRYDIELLKENTEEFYSSRIINHSQRDQIEEWTNRKFGRLCYRGSRDGINAKVFHENCSKVKPSVTVIYSSTGAIFGGYTTRTWKDSTLKNDDCAMLFSLTLNKKYQIQSGKYAINSGTDLLPSFGNNDLYLTEAYCEVSQQMINFKGDSSLFELNKGQKHFTISVIEVFQMDRP